MKQDRRPSRNGVRLGCLGLLVGSLLVSFPTWASIPSWAGVPSWSIVDGPDYERDIAPLLAQKCLACHGPEREASGLRVDRWRSLLEGGEYGLPAIVPGDPAASFLLQVVDGSSDDLSMPPDGNPPLTTVEIGLLRQWIAAGAVVPDTFAADDEDPTRWWSLQPIKRPVLQEPGSAIDELIGAKLREQGLGFSPPAERVSLIRRLYLVMLGLPPTPEEVHAFVTDPDPQAWERLVDQVLASPHYGERWARHWLDVVRFGETDGYETNRERPNAWRYRDWVIAAFNQDMPYHDFLRYQLAGDVLGQPIGTSFLVGGPHDIVKSPDPLLTLTQRQDELTDMVATVGSAFLGLTIGCARCHNHKFDPISQVDFFAWQAIFAGVHHGESRLPTESTETTAAKRAIEEAMVEWQQDLLAYLATQDPQSVVWPPVDPAFNLEVFAPQMARMVRMTIRATNSGEPCLDELEIFAGSQQVGLASQGAQLSSSGDYPNNPKHRLMHLNDGQYGNDYSWISDTAGSGWVRIEWEDPLPVDRIHWARDRQAIFADRLATDYQFEVSMDGEIWTLVADSRRRLPVGSPESSLYDHRMISGGVDAAADENVKLVSAPVAGANWLGRDSQTFGQRLQAIRRQAQVLSGPALAFCGTFGQPEVIHKLFRGDPLSPREEVGPDHLAIFGSLNLPADASDPQRRLALADALVHEDNPLVSRVIVNRVWQYHFGVGLVETASDFGRNAPLPSHPELLDWLALRFRETGGSIKQLQREILLSRTWQQSSRPQTLGMERDAGSRWLWRFPPRRLEAEIIRDQMLAVSGALQSSGGGPGFSAFEVELENVRHYYPLEDFGPEHFRRMVYQTKVRQEQDAVFGAFDCPDGTQIAPQRSRSTTPLQALNLFNSKFVLLQAEWMAQRLTEEVGDDPERQIQRAFQLCFGREPEVEEWPDLSAFVEQQGVVAVCRVLLNSNEFLFIP